MVGDVMWSVTDRSVSFDPVSFFLLLLLLLSLLLAVRCCCCYSSRPVGDKKAIYC